MESVIKLAFLIIIVGVFLLWLGSVWYHLSNFLERFRKIEPKESPNEPAKYLDEEAYKDPTV